MSSASVKFLNGWAHGRHSCVGVAGGEANASGGGGGDGGARGFEFMVTGHSLGGGVAACVTMLMHSADRDLESLVMRDLKGDGRVHARRRTETHGGVPGACIASPSVTSMNLSEAASDYVGSSSPARMSFRACATMPPRPCVGNHAAPAPRTSSGVGGARRLRSAVRRTERRRR